ncbi:MAG: alpha/beta hydrolase family protein [Pseudonocardiaceae bacterium]
MITATRNVGLTVPDRLNVVFSDNGRYATSLRTSAEHVVLERWTLDADELRCQTIPDVPVDRATHALPLDDGRMLLFQRSKTPASDQHEFAVLDIETSSFSLSKLGEVTAPLGGYLLPSPNSDQLGFAITLGVGQSTIWRLPAPPRRREQLMRLPGSLTGGVWLDGAAGVLGVNHTNENSSSSGIAVFLSQGSWKRIWSMADSSNDQILLYSPRSKLVIVSSNASGQQRLGWALRGEPTVHFREALHRRGYPRAALTLDDRGEKLLIHEVTGATSQLLVYTPADDRLEALAGPPGRMSPPASWTGDFVRFRFSTPCHTPALATVRLGRRPRWSLSRGHDLGIHYGGPHPQLIELDGPAGPVETIVYGGPDWRRRERLVIALHGGPLSSWRFQLEPLFDCLSAHGAAVVAPNYRGSTGYGDEHLHAVIGKWGGPDLDDVLHLGRNLATDRAPRRLPGPVVLGLSYGAFLALLAASHEPQLWSACAAVAPFLSAARFHDSANTAVRRRIEQLGGLRRIEDAIGPRDVLRSCASLSAPLLLLHGAKDETIPVTQSRTLKRRLLELGKIEGIDFEYAEVDNDHAGLVSGSCRELNQRLARFCLSPPRPPRPMPRKASSHCDGKRNESTLTTTRR